MAETTPSQPRVHLNYLDGLRGLAALYVTQYHALNYVSFDDKATGWTKELAFLFGQGHFAVVAFIVLSGYCLMLPITRRGELRGGVKGFWYRRARRILPPYYATLVLCAILGSVAIKLRTKSAAEVYNPTDWITHILLIHNLRMSTIITITGPLWSVATEWQIYFVFVFLLLPLWKRFGSATAALTGTALGIALAVGIPGLRTACPWFIGMFAMGMAATLLYPATPTPDSRQRKWPWGWMAAGCLAATYVIIRLHIDWIMQQNGAVPPLIAMLPDFVFGAGCTCLIISCTSALQNGRPSALSRCLSWRPLVFLGGFSYSLYLIHSLLQSGFSAILAKLPLAFLHSQTVIYPVLIAISLAGGYLFHLAFERPFLQAAPPAN